MSNSTPMGDPPQFCCHCSNAYRASVGITLYQQEPDAALRAKYASAVRTLQDIAGGDYRGNRSHEQNLAYRTLAQLGEPVEP